MSSLNSAELQELKGALEVAKSTRRMQDEVAALNRPGAKKNQIKPGPGKSAKKGDKYVKVLVLRSWSKHCTDSQCHQLHQDLPANQLSVEELEAWILGS